MQSQGLGLRLETEPSVFPETQSCHDAFDSHGEPPPVLKQTARHPLDPPILIHVDDTRSPRSRVPLMMQKEALAFP
jgi:hypothetical protein